MKKKKVDLSVLYCFICQKECKEGTGSYVFNSKVGDEVFVCDEHKEIKKC